MPGMENFAPERTETSSGSLASPSFLPFSFSIAATASSIWADSSAGSLPCSRYALQASVVIVKVGGTGRPMLCISARLAPLPPSRSFMSLLPSERP